VHIAAAVVGYFAYKKFKQMGWGPFKPKEEQNNDYHKMGSDKVDQTGESEINNQTNYS
jgi:hypothetical protein